MISSRFPVVGWSSLPASEQLRHWHAQGLRYPLKHGDRRRPLAQLHKPNVAGRHFRPLGQVSLVPALRLAQSLDRHVQPLSRTLLTLREQMCQAYTFGRAAWSLITGSSHVLVEPLEE